MSESMVDTTQNTRITFLSRDSFPLIELVELLGEKSLVVKTLDSVGITPYHVCYSVKDIDAAVAALRKEHFLPLFKLVEAIALGNKKICYLYSKKAGLIELTEEK